MDRSDTKRLGQHVINADQWRQIVNSAIDTAILTLDVEGRITSWSAGAQAILGWTEAEMLGRTLDVLMPDGEGSAVRAEMAEARTHGRGGQEGWRIRKDGSRFWATGELTPIRRETGDIGGFIKILRDRSAQRAAEQAMQDERRALEIINRAMSSLTQESDLDRLVQIVTDAGVEMTGGEFGAFFYNVEDEAGESYMLYTLSGVPAEAFSQFPKPRITAVFAPTFAGEGIVRSDDITQDPRYGDNAPYHGMPKGHLPVRSYLAVPVISREGGVIGGLLFGHSSPGIFTDQSERGLMALAGEAAVAIDNARLFQALEKELNQRYAAEADLAHSEQRLRFANDAADIGTWDFDPVTQELRWDERCKAHFGLPSDTEIGYESSFLGGLHPEDRERMDQAVQASLTPGGDPGFDTEYRTLSPDGTLRWIAANGRTYFDAAGRAARFIGTTIDITRRKTYESELRVLNEQLESRVASEIAQRADAEDALRQAQKMEAVGQLTGGIAHDFNNLLTVVTGNIGMAKRSLEAGGTADPRAQRSLDNALKGAERAAALTQRLLAFARRQPLAPRALDVDRLVVGMSDLINRSLGELVRLEIVTSPGLWTVEADPNQLESAILNLCLNARDAMPEGGDLTIETANAHLDQGYAANQAEVPPGQYVMVAVTDSGSGMSRAVMERVFEPFFTTKEVGKGTGLGLSMIYGFVKQSGGHVKLYSEEGVGTTVKIYLPRVLSAAIPPEKEEEAVSAGAEQSLRQETILVVEDDDDVRAYSVESLRELGYQVLEAHDGPTALRMVEDRAEPVDLLFTDVVMPGMSGRELVEAARRLQPNLRVLYTSGYTRNAIAHAGRLDPGVEVIIKPFTYEALASRIRDVLDAGRTDSVLVVEAEPTIRSLTAESLAGLGFRAEEAGTAREALSKVAAARGRYDVVLVDAALPDRRGDGLAAEMRALHADLPIVIVSEGPLDEIAARFVADRCVAVIARPYNGAALQAAFGALGVRGRGGQGGMGT